MDANYSIIWKHFKKDSQTGTHLGAHEDFSLPYFLDGQEKLKLEQKEQVNLNPFHLVKGLLVGYFDKPPATDTTFAKKHARLIVEEQLAAFKSPSLESLILDLSTYLRDTHGQEVSLQSLMAGTELLPDSSSIKYDCCIDLINCIEDDQLKDRSAAVQKLKLLLHGIKMEDLNNELVDDYNRMIEISKEL